MKKFDWVICFGYDINSPSVVSTKHYINYFYSKGIKVLWFNPLPFRNISIKNYGRRTFYYKVLNKIKTHIKLLRIPRKNFLIYSPIYFPNFSNKIYKNINIKILRFQFNLLLKINNITNYFVWTTGSFTINYIFPIIRDKFILYQAADFISDFRGIDLIKNNELRNKEYDVCIHSSIIITASHKIREKILGLSNNIKDVFVVSHGVDYYHFSRPKKTKNSIFESIERPIVGYYGSLTSANDQDVFIKLANAGFSVIIIGKVSADYSNCYSNENIYFLGPIKYEILPSYAQKFDVCLLNWKMADWIINSYPKKTLEYLAMGKPIVSVPIPELQLRFSNLIYFANSPDEFVKIAWKAYFEDNSKYISLRKDAVKNQTWDKKGQYVEQLILGKLDD